MSTSLPLENGTWTLDPAHSQVGFKIRHLGITTIRGSFPASAATVHVADGKADITVDIDAASISTGNEYRDQHLLAPDFFDAANHPKLTFVATKIEAATESTGTIHGDLTIRGITKPVALATTFHGLGTNPMDQSTRAGFQATGSINRSDFGVSFGIPMASDEVRLAIDLQLVKQ
jgi:polyisoprenoid-binding protein YceI